MLYVAYVTFVRGHNTVYNNSYVWYLSTLACFTTTTTGQMQG